MLRYTATALVLMILLTSAPLWALLHAPQLSAANAVATYLPPSSIEIGDSEELVLSFNVSLSSVTEANPTVAFILTVKGLSPEHFSYSSLSYSAQIILPSEVRNVTDLVEVSYVNESEEVIQLSMYFSEALPSADFNLSIALGLDAKRLFNVSDHVFYRLVISSGSNPYLLVEEHEVEVSIVPKPPSPQLLLFEPKPYIAAPGTVLNATLRLYDASGVENVTLLLIREGWPGRSASMGLNGSVASEVRLSIDTLGLDEGVYRVVARSCDTLGICGEEALLSVNLTRTFYVPSLYFSKLSEALAHRGLLPGTTIVVISNITEGSSVAITTPNITVRGVGTPAVTIASSPGVVIAANHTVLKSLSIVSPGTAIEIRNSSNATIEGVYAWAQRFLEVAAPISVAELWAHRIEGCRLNNTPVTYLYGGGGVANITSVETHLVFGSYVVNSSSLGSLYLVNATAVLRDTYLSTYSLRNSRLLQLWSLEVRVTFAGKPVEGAEVEAVNNMTSVRSYTDENGLARLYIPYINATDTRVLRANTTRVTARKSVFTNTTYLEVDRPSSIALELPAPSLSVRVADMTGAEKRVFRLGEVAAINISVASAPAVPMNISIAIGNESVVVTQPTPHNLTMLFRVWSTTVITVKLSIDGLPEVEAAPIAVEVKTP